MKKNEIGKIKVRVTSNDPTTIRNTDTMKAFTKKFSANITILTYIRGDKGSVKTLPFEPFSHIIEG